MLREIEKYIGSTDFHSVANLIFLSIVFILLS